MNWNIFKPHSLKARVTFLTLAVFVIGIWSLTFYVSRILREDMERVLSAQQLSAASFIADEVNNELDGRCQGSCRLCLDC